MEVEKRGNSHYKYPSLPFGPLTPLPPNLARIQEVRQRGSQELILKSVPRLGQRWGERTQLRIKSASSQE